MTFIVVYDANVLYPNTSRLKSAFQLTRSKAAKQRQVRRFSEPEPIKLPRFEPADGVMLFWLQVRHGPPPAPRDPHSQVQTSLRDNPVQHRAAIDALELSPQLLGHLPPERIFGALARLDVTTGEVPHIWKPPSAWRTVTQQQLVPPAQDHGNNVMILHRPSIPLTGQRFSDAALAPCDPPADQRPTSAS